MRRSWSPFWIEEVAQDTYDALRDAYMPPLPPIDSAPGYLIGYLFRIGPTVAGAMSAAPITDLQIRAFQDNSGIRLSPWESEALIRLSKEFAAESFKATAQFYPPPWWPDDEPRPMTKEEALLARQKAMFE